jgi:kynurenine formamidase
VSNAIDRAEFDELYERCSNWGRWGPDDQRGALNLIDPAEVAAAAAQATAGRSVSCSRVLDTSPAIDNPHSAVHRMTTLPVQTKDPPMSAATDYLGLECHGEVHSHLDALCHIAWRGKLYNGWPAGAVTDKGASVLDLGVLHSGIVSRGVLLDIPALRGQPWLLAGDAVSRDELIAAEAAAGVTVGSGDVVLLRTGHALRREVDGPWDSANEKAGLDPRAMPWFKERDVAALAFDGDGDAMPHPVAGVSAPVHVLGINAMGLHFFDALSLEDLAETCAGLGRWEFLFVASPLRAAGATGCAINPLAIF